MEIASHSPEETMRIAEAVGELLRPGDLLNLNGELGAGKTLLSRDWLRHWVFRQKW